MCIVIPFHFFFCFTAGRMARRRGGFPATLFLSLCLLAAAVLLCSAEEPLGLAADDAPDFAIGDWLSSLVSGPSREEREALERQRRAETRPRKVLLALGCLGLAAFLLIRRTAETIEERDDRPVHVALAFSGAEGARRARFPREKCRTLGDLKGLISRSEACGRPHGSSQTIVFNGRELVDDELDLGVLLPGVTGAEDWADQRVFPNAWTAQTVKEPKRRARDVSWGLCRRIEADSPGLALVAFALLALCADIF